jgi:hypothetical protein
MTLAFKDNIRTCITNGRVVMLDLDRADYLCLPDDIELVLQKALSSSELSASERDCIRELIEDGLLVETSDSQGSLAPPLPAPTEEFPASAGDVPWWKIGIAPSFHVIAATALTVLPLTKAVTPKRLRRTHQAKSESQIREILRQAANTFEASERLYPSNNKCLRRSLALAKFLTTQGIAAKLVIAVKMRPFGAHAWVQFDDLVVNDTLDNVRPFTPIYVV